MIISFLPGNSHGQTASSSPSFSLHQIEENHPGGTLDKWPVITERKHSNAKKCYKIKNIQCFPFPIPKGNEVWTWTWTLTVQESWGNVAGSRQGFSRRLTWRMSRWQHRTDRKSRSLWQEQVMEETPRKSAVLEESHRCFRLDGQ